MNCCAKKLSIALLALLSIPCFGQRYRTERWLRDSVEMENYTKKISKSVTYPIILKQTDTLFDMAGKLDNKRRQAYALCLKLDYYYTRQMEDSIMTNVERIMQFCEKNDQPIHYYFAWQRKITYYMTHSMLNTALHEIRLMQEDAIKRDYYPIRVDAEKLMGRFYISCGLHEEAEECYSNAIQLYENAPEGVEIPNAYSLYLNYVQTLLSLEEYDKIEETLEKCAALSETPVNLGSVYAVYTSYYLRIKDLTKAKEYHEKAKEIEYDKISINGKHTMLRNRINIAKEEKEYSLALQLLDSLKDTGFEDKTYYVDNAALLYKMGRYKEAYSYIIKQANRVDSIRKEDFRNGISEMVVMLDVSRIEAENAKKELELRKEMLTYSLFFAGVLFILSIVLIFWVLKYNRVNKKLKISEENLIEAIKKIEEGSRVKSKFLQHLSHEIRTPLNSIVGFSDILSEALINNSEYENYLRIIHESSGELIKLVNDAVDISEYDKVLPRTDTDVNQCFKLALNYMDIPLHENVRLRFEPFKGGECRVMREKEKVVKILANVIHNAAKSTTSGEIVVSVKIASDRVIYSVTDSGPGIPRDKHKFVFEYFAKLDQMSQGLGLGLPLSRMLAKSMGGSLTIDGDYTKGCRMTFSFPYLFNS